MSKTFYTSYGDGLPDEYYNIVGKVAVAWALIETDLEFVIWLILGLITSDDPSEIKTAQALTTHMGFQTRIHTILTLVHNKTGNSDEFKELNTLLTNKLDELRGKRNEVIHGLPAIEPTSPINVYIPKVRAKGKLQYKVVNYSKKDLYEIIDQIHELRENLKSLAVWHVAWPDRFSPQQGK